MRSLLLWKGLILMNDVFNKFNALKRAYTLMCNAKDTGKRIQKENEFLKLFLDLELELRVLQRQMNEGKKEQ